MASLTIVPRRDRDYTSQAQVKAAWNEGKDFIVQDFFSGFDGATVNKADADQFVEKGTRIMARYARLTKMVQVQ
jgi:hypothetical protein